VVVAQKRALSVRHPHRGAELTHQYFLFKFIKKIKND